MSRYWLFKTEPNEFSLADLAQKGVARWEGIRNYTARNYLRDGVRLDDRVFIYHSSCALVGVVGVAKVVKTAYTDPTQFEFQSPYYDPKSQPENPRWLSVDLAFVKQLTCLVPLRLIKETPALQQMALIKQPRLSIQPVSDAEQLVIYQLAQT